MFKAEIDNMHINRKCRLCDDRDEMQQTGTREIQD